MNTFNCYRKATKFSLLYLKENIEGDGVHHMFDDDAEDCVGSALSFRLTGKGLSRLESSLGSSTLLNC